MRTSSILLCLALFLALPLRAQEAQVSSKAPRDRPVSVSGEAAWKDMQARLAPAVREARASYPAARARYLAELPQGEIFFVTVHLRDADGRREQVFLRADSIGEGRIHGRIWSAVRVVSGFRGGQPHSVAEEEIVDWTIAGPKGTEEGNFVGKFLDRMRAEAAPTRRPE